jgi:hypothetical protein
MKVEGRERVAVALHPVVEEEWLRRGLCNGDGLAVVHRARVASVVAIRGLVVVVQVHNAPAPGIFRSRSNPKQGSDRSVSPVGGCTVSLART